MVLKDTMSKSIFAHACPCKGAHEAVVTRIIHDLDVLGYRKVLVRTDGEPAILDLWAKVKEQWWGEIIKVEAATGDHDANGEAEQCVQKIEDEVRTWKNALDDAIKGTVPPTHDILSWLVEHVASINRRTAIGPDGKTPLERTRGRRGRDVMAQFGESVLYLPLRGDLGDRRKAKIEFEPRFLDGIYLGLLDRSDEMVLFGPEGGPKGKDNPKKTRRRAMAPR